MTQEEIIHGIAHVCAVIFVNAESSDVNLLKQLNDDKNRAVIVSTVIHIAIRIAKRKPKVMAAFEWQVKLSPQELANAIRPHNFISDAEFVLLVESEIERLKSFAG
jgi:hypothetical protein